MEEEKEAVQEENQPEEESKPNVEQPSPAKEETKPAEAVPSDIKEEPVPKSKKAPWPKDKKSLFFQQFLFYALAAITQVFAYVFWNPMMEFSPILGGILIPVLLVGSIVLFIFGINRSLRFLYLKDGNKEDKPKEEAKPETAKQ